VSIRHRTVLTLLATGVAGAVLGAWLVLALQLAHGRRSAGHEPDGTAGSAASGLSAEEALSTRFPSVATSRPRLLGAALAVAAALLLAGRLARQLARRVSAAGSSTIERPPPATRQQPVAFVGSPELVQVGASFGRMVDDIQRRYREVARHRDQLEAELLARTRELAQAQEAVERTTPPRPRRRESGNEPPMPTVSPRQA
jgi:hypothetical protein